MNKKLKLASLYIERNDFASYWFSRFTMHVHACERFKHNLFSRKTRMCFCYFCVRFERAVFFHAMNIYLLIFFQVKDILLYNLYTDFQKFNLKSSKNVKNWPAFFVFIRQVFVPCS